MECSRFISAKKERQLLKPVVCQCSVLFVIELLKCELHLGYDDPDDLTISLLDQQI